MIQSYKETIDISYQDIQDRIFKLKEKEKNMITDRLEFNVTDEEREADTILKINKLGVWSKGLEKGLRSYVKENYDKEKEFKDTMMEYEKKVGSKKTNLEDFEDYKDDYLEQIQQEEEIDREAYDMSHMTEDYMDGNEYEGYEVDDYEDDVLEVAPPIVPAPVDLKVSRKAALKPKVTTILSDVNESMPHNIECPSDLEAFDGLVDEFVHNAADLRALIDRILVWNSVNLPGKQGADNKNKMHNFMDILLKLFVREADALSTAILPAEVSAIQQQVSQ